MRVFFAVMLPESLCKALSPILVRLKEVMTEEDLRFVAPENLHLTLQFLKDLHPEKVQTLIKKVQAATNSIAPFNLQLCHLEWFPSERHPRYLTLIPKKQKPLIKIAAQLGSIISELGYPLEKRAFRGHLTLARLKKDKSSWMSLSPYQGYTLPQTPIHNFSLMESRPTKEYRQYFSLAEFMMRG